MTKSIRALTIALDDRAQCNREPRLGLLGNRSASRESILESTTSSLLDGVEDDSIGDPGEDPSLTAPALDRHGKVEDGLLDWATRFDFGHDAFTDELPDCRSDSKDQSWATHVHS